VHHVVIVDYIPELNDAFDLVSDLTYVTGNFISSHKES